MSNYFEKHSILKKLVFFSILYYNKRQAFRLILFVKRKVTRILISEY